MNLWKRRTAAIATLAVLGTVSAAVSTPAPRSGGISGHSGKQGRICTECHGGGVVPTVTLSGPTTLQAGSTGRFTLTISGGQQIAGGLNVAADDGTFAPANADTKILGGEITHTMEKMVDGNGDVMFEFDWTAPATGGAIVMYGAGNSVNLNGGTSGDNAAADTLTIDVDPGCQVDFTEFGQGLAGSGGFEPTLLGTDGDCSGAWVFQIDQVLGGASGALWIGFGQTNIPAFGGEFYVDLGLPFLLLPTTVSGPAGVPGAGSSTFTGFDLSGFAGVTLYLQGTFIDAGAPAGISLTNGLEMAIG